MLYVGPYRHPGWVSAGFAILLFVLGTAAFSTGEYIREAARKPYVVYNVVMSNGIYPQEVARLRAIGYLEGGTWTRAYVRSRYGQLIDETGGIDERRVEELAPAGRRDLGRVIFQYHCNSCHATAGYSGMRELTRGWTPELLRTVVEHPERMRFFMPPFAGTPEEAGLLVDYLTTLAPAAPPGMMPDGVGR
jgi:mono/diheme cytochrome c family protein